VKTVNDLRSCIPDQTSVIISRPSECHGRPPTPSPNEAMVPTGCPPIQLSQAAALCDAAPDSAITEMTRTALADAICDSSTNVEGSCVVKTITESLPPDPSLPSGSNACEKISGNNTPANLTTPSSSIDQRTLPQSADNSTLLSAENSSILQSAEKTSPATPSSCAEQNSTGRQENSSSASPLDAQSNSSVKAVNDLQSCIPGLSSAIPSEGSECHSRAPTSSPIQLSQSTTSCNAARDSATIEITPTTLADAICDSGTNDEGSCVVNTIAETSPSDPSPPLGFYAYQPTCVSGRSK